ncbi:Putative TEGT family carrier/transport protein [hydrothermal vent metagenome]|uniref:TEGT family carrier/transport protein n=1 Tax=hydrothermal vent metagenome TaxID=652676 RepID=A0A3B0X698_9ZZZZ
MNNPNISIGRSQESILATNKVLKNTYALLSITLIFSAITAFIGMQMQIGQGVAMIATFGAIGILWFVLPRTANSAAGIPTIFAFTGLIGLGMAPMLNMYLAVNPSVVSTALGGTGIIFLGLSGYVLTTRKDFNFMGGFLMVGMMVVFVAALANIFLQMPIMSLVVSGAIVMLMSGMILYQTSSIIHGGETNYINATATLFLSIINLFQALLHLLSAFSGND